MARILECVEAHCEVQDVEMGKVYRWCPERIVVRCGCGERLSLTASMTYCAGCGADHAVAVEEEVPNQRQGEEVLRPWRYSEDREDRGIPV